MVVRAHTGTEPQNVSKPEMALRYSSVTNVIVTYPFYTKSGHFHNHTTTPYYPLELTI